MSARSYQDLLISVTENPFSYIDPPFNFNAPEVSRYPPEVTGFHLLESMRRRLGWDCFNNKTLLDFGCGVRLARTIHNLGLPLAGYVGVDVNAQAIAWLIANVTDARFHFAHLDARNAFYNPGGTVDPQALARLNLPACDAACMFSVITHQAPDEAHLTLEQLRIVAKPGGRLYFTAFLDDTVQQYSAGSGMKISYAPDTLN